MATLRVIAEKAGVSIRTASVALNGDPLRGRITADRVRIIRGIARDLGYRPHAGARAMRDHRFRQIGLLFRVDTASRLAHALMLEMLLGMNDALQPHGYVMSLVPVDDASSPAELPSRALRERALDNVIVVDTIPSPVRICIQETFPQAVWANADVWQATNCVRRDEVAAGRMAVQQMAALGYRKVVYIDREKFPHYSFGDRRRGAMEAAKALDLEARVLELSLPPAPDAQRQAALAPLLQRDTAVVVGDVYMARSLQQSFANLNRCPGADFAICCCDDADELGEVWPELARVTFQRFALGRAAGEMTLRTLLEPGSIQTSIVMTGQWQPGLTARVPQELAGSFSFSSSLSPLRR